jgi:hypothetical protein
MSARVAQRHVLDRIAAPNLRVYVVWEPVHDGDNRQAAEAATALMADPRLTHFWAEDLRLAEAFKAPLGLRKSVAWDVAMLFSPGAWREPVPTPVHVEHVLDELPPDQRLNGLKLRSAVEAALRQAALPATASPSRTGSGRPPRSTAP